VNSEGAFIGDGIPLLRRDDLGDWHPRRQAELESALIKFYGFPVSIKHRIAGLTVVANALNNGNFALANIALVLLKFPIDNLDETDPFGSSPTGLSKFDPDQPRAPAGSPDGGQWSRTPGAPVKAPANGSNAHPNIVDVAYNGGYHDRVVKYLADAFRANGSLVETNISLTTIDGATTAIADILLRPPAPGALFILEVKTGDDPGFTPSQRVIYPMATIGWHVLSSSPRIANLGFPPDAPLPPMEVFQVYAEPGKEFRVNTLPPEFDKRFTFSFLAEGQIHE
jgi:hypothetical protein